MVMGALAFFSLFPLKGVKRAGDLCSGRFLKRAISQGFERVTSNMTLPLKYTLASGWEEYESGVFDDCLQEAAVNGPIRISWEKEWGEEGRVRILCFADGSDGYCGTDYHPQEGMACDVEASPAPLRGMRLMDSPYPIGVKVSDGVSSR